MKKGLYRWRKGKSGEKETKKSLSEEVCIWRKGYHVKVEKEMWKKQRERESWRVEHSGKKLQRFHEDIKCSGLIARREPYFLYEHLWLGNHKMHCGITFLDKIQMIEHFSWGITWRDFSTLETRCDETSILIVTHQEIEGSTFHGIRQNNKIKFN